MTVKEIAQLLQENTKLRVQSQFHIEETGKAYLFNGTASELLRNDFLGGYDRYQVREVRFLEQKEAFVCVID